LRYTLTEQALQKLGTILIERMRREIMKKQYPYGRPNIKGRGDKYATGGLYDSLGFQIVRPQGGQVLGTAPAITITSSPNLPGKTYNLFDVVTYGVPKNKARPPLESIMNWIRVRGIRPRDKRGRFLPNNEENIMSLAWAVKQNIFKYGIRPADIFGKGKRNLDQLFADPPNYLRDEVERILEAIGGDIENFFDNIIEK
jgi:hypothetical protein